MKAEKVPISELWSQDGIRAGTTIENASHAFDGTTDPRHTSSSEAHLTLRVRSDGGISNVGRQPCDCR
jgi:hypothetical protein